MRLARLVPVRWRSVAHEVLKFGIVGGVNTVVNFAVLNALIVHWRVAWLGLDVTVLPNGQLKANVIATVIAATTSYFMNRHWTYRDRPRAALRREYTLFFLFNATGLAIELGILGITKYGLGETGIVAINVAKAIGVALGTIFRFWSYRTFVFLPHTADVAELLPEQTGGQAPVAARATTVAPSPSLPGDDEVLPRLTAELGPASANP